ncbi:MAG: cell division protein ZapA [Alkalibacterium sp.]|nr:cell division protein ZapA [Alkalibacterium sp.]
MSEGKRRFKATIDGETYTIVGSKPEKHMRVVAETVDEQLSQLKELTKGLDKEKRAILLAINAVSDQLAMRNELEHLKEKYEQLEQDQKN